VWRKEMECETEVWSWEDGERFNEDVGYGFVFGEMGVELISVGFEKGWLVWMCFV
jgi:hypothetical protein